MAKKKLDLTEQYGKEEQPEAKKKVSKYSHFLESELKTPPANPASKSAGGQNDSKRINMAFSDANYEMMQSECIRLNINLTHFINSLIRLMENDEIDEYISSQSMRLGSSAPKRKGHQLKRSNIRFPIDNYEKMFAGAQKHGATITQYVNLILEMYAKDLEED